MSTSSPLETKTLSKAAITDITVQPRPPSQERSPKQLKLSDHERMIVAIVITKLMLEIQHRETNKLSSLSVKFLQVPTIAGHRQDCDAANVDLGALG